MAKPSTISARVKTYRTGRLAGNMSHVVGDSMRDCLDRVRRNEREKCVTRLVLRAWCWQMGAQELRGSLPLVTL